MSFKANCFLARARRTETTRKTSSPHRRRHGECAAKPHHGSRRRRRPPRGRPPRPRARPRRRPQRPRGRGAPLRAGAAPLPVHTRLPPRLLRRLLPRPPRRRRCPCASCRAAAFCSPACAAAAHPRVLCAALSHGGGAGLTAAAPTEAVQEPLLFLLAAYSLPDPALRAVLSLSSAPPPPPGAQDVAGLHAAVAALAPPHLLPAGFSPDLTAALLAKDRGNSFAIMEPYRPGMSLELLKARAYAVYPQASLFNHDCLPNACHFDYPDRPGPGNTDIVVRALHDISEGREVCISYFAANWRYADRQRRLLEDYGFRCECDRCQVESRWKEEEEEEEEEEEDDGDDGDDAMEEEEDGGDGGDDGMEEEGDGDADGDDDFPHAYFFVRYLCDSEGCWGMLAPLPPSPNGELSHVFECNLCGKLRKEEDAMPDEGGSGMVH